MDDDITKKKKYGEPDKTGGLSEAAQRQLSCARAIYEIQHPSIVDRIEKKGRKGAGLEHYNN